MSEEFVEIADDEVEIPDVMITAAVEEILHNAGIEVRRVPLGPGPDDVMTLLRFHTPYKVYSIKLDNNGVDILQKALGGRNSEILIARPGDIPGLR